MPLFRTTIGAASFTIAFLTASREAGAVPLSEFDRAPQEQRSQYIASALKQIHGIYENSDDRQHYAICMERAFLDASESGHNDLLQFIVIELETARNDEERDPEVHEILAGTIVGFCDGRYED